MKILVATGIFPPQIGGPATYSKLLLDELPKRGVEVEIANFGDHLDKPWFIRHYSYFCEVLKKAETADIVFAQDPVSAGLPALLASQICNKRFFIRVAGDYAWEQGVQRFGVTDSIDEFQTKTHDIRTEILKKVQRFVVGSAEKVITPSVYFKHLVSSWFPSLTTVEAIYNGIEFLDTIPTKTAARKMLGISRTEKILVSSGRLVPWKGFELLIKIVGSYKREGTPVRLFIIGDGPQRGSLEKLIKEEDVVNEVIITGSVSREVMLRHIVAADTFVLNTQFESFSFAIVEAMRAGTTVISTPVGSIPELIEHGTEGILVPFDDQKGFIEAITAVLGDAKVRKTYTKHAFRKSNLFSITQTIDNLIKLL